MRHRVSSASVRPWMHSKAGIGRAAVAIIVIVILVVAGAALYFATLPSSVVTTSTATAPVSLTVWGWSGNAGYLVSVANHTGFTQQYPYIKLNPVGQPSAADQYNLLSTAAATGSGAACVVGVEVDRAQYFISKGILRSLDPYGIQNYASDFPAWWLQFFKGSNSSIYGVPWDASGAAVLYYNSAIFQKYGLTPPTTMAQFEQQGLELKKLDPSIYYTIFGTDSVQWLLMMVNSQQAQVFNQASNGAWVSNLDSPAALRAMEFMRDMVGNGSAAAVPFWTSGNYAAVQSNEYATLLMPQWMAGFMETWLAPNDTGVWRAAPFPEWTPGVKISANWGGTAYAITTQCPDPQAAWAFLKWDLLDASRVEALYQTAKYLPAFEPSWSGSVVSYNDSYFGGQNINLLVTEQAEPYVPAINYPSYMTLFYSYGGAAYQKVLLGNETASTALSQANSQINANIAASS